MSTQFDRDHRQEATARDRVLAFLVANVGTWVPAHAITDPAVGGSEGLRRQRELKALGYRIEQRKHDTGTERDYRLVSSVPDAAELESARKTRPTKAQIRTTLAEVLAVYQKSGTPPSESVRVTMRWLQDSL